jgi:outer membrane protein assembly factor BamB
MSRTAWSRWAARDVNSSPEVANGAVYVGSDNNEILALNASTGS